MSILLGNGLVVALGVITFWAVVQPARCADPVPPRLIPVNASTMGMGYASVALVDNPGIVYWNPAGLAASGLMLTDVSIAGTTLEAPGSWSALLVNAPPGAGQKFGMGFVRHSTATDAGGIKTFQMLVPVSYDLRPGLPVGFSAKFICEKPGDEDWNYGLAVDGGAMLMAKDSWALGFAVQNLFGSDLAGFKRQSWLGASIGSRSSFFTVASQVKLVKGFGLNAISEYNHLGGSLRVGESFPEAMFGRVRDGEDTWLTAGVGYHIRKNNTHLAYAVSYNSDGWGERMHLLTYGFGTPNSDGVVGASLR